MSNAASVMANLAQDDAQKQAAAPAPSGSNAASVMASLAASNGQATAPTGPTIGPQPTASSMPTFGESWMPPEQRLTMPLVKALIAAHDKLRDVENFTQEGRAEHPVQAALGDVADSIEGFLIGGPQNASHGIGSGQYGILTNPVTASLLPGTEGAPALASTIEGGANLVKQGYQAVKGGVQAVSDLASGGKTVVTKIARGASAADAPAQAALRSGAAASASDAGVTATTDASAGIRTLLDQPIADAAKNERSLYDTVNDAAETDMKSLYDHREDVLDALSDPTNVANRSALADELATTDKAIQVHSDLAASKGVSMDTLNEAKAATQQRYAMETLDQKLFNNENVVSGDVAHGAPETVNVDAAIRAVQNLDKPSKFAPRGTPTRLVQALGEDGAAALKQGLYDAQKAGQSALKVQQIAKYLGYTAGGGALVTGSGLLVHRLLEK
ncbi:MAG TPA: hypothetical protein VN087_02630 [Verrucomicrobiae bacterium]|jgi:hypothetical protein|nr:hypothetical protein [Verrucomicrobiae bacterium]